jgi:hypothetical protein
MDEVKRIQNVSFEREYKTNCVKCGKEIELRWNHGELDWSFCCGYEYELEHARVDLVVRKKVE